MLEMLLGQQESVEDRIERLRPKTLPEARIEQLQLALTRQQKTDWKEGDLVMPTTDSSINQAYIGEPHIVLMVRPIGAHDCGWEETVFVATVDADGSIQATWCAPWRLETYVPRVKQ